MSATRLLSQLRNMQAPQGVFPVRQQTKKSGQSSVTHSVNGLAIYHREVMTTSVGFLLDPARARDCGAHCLRFFRWTADG